MPLVVHVFKFCLKLNFCLHQAMKYLMIIWILWKIFNWDFKMWVQILGLFTYVLTLHVHTCILTQCESWTYQSWAQMLWHVIMISSVNTLSNWSIIDVWLDSWHNQLEDICWVFLLLLLLLLLFLVHHS